MSTTSQRSSSRTNGKSIFFQDIASPISSHRGKFASPGQAAAVSALWRENFGSTDPPPPPVFTLEDRVDFSPESGVVDFTLSSDSKSDMKTPIRGELRQDSVTPLRSRFDASGPNSVKNGGQQQHFQQGSPASSNWWSPGGRSGSEDKGKGSPVDGMVHSGALITLPPPREVARPEMQKNTLLPVGNLDEEEWVTVYGFSPGDTNLVLREFEKCGTILKHVPGPRSANWMHILYQSRFDAHKALNKSGMQINAVLIVGVKPLDPFQRQALNEGPTNQGFMILPHPSTRSTELIPSKVFPRPYHLQNGGQTTQRSAGVIASPAKSVVSKIADLMFGI